MNDEITNLVRELGSNDVSGRLQAAERLVQMGEAAQAAAVPLVRASCDSDETVREWSTSALEELGPPDPAALTSLSELLSDPNEATAYWAATLLGRLGEQAVEEGKQRLARVISRGDSLPLSHTF